MPTAHNDNRLVETIPAPLVVSSWRNYVIFVGTPVALFCCAISIVAWVNSGWQASLVMALIFGAPSAIFVFGIASGLHRNLRMQNPTVELWGDELTVRYGAHTLIASVKDCHLHRGRAWNMRLRGTWRVGGVKLYSPAPVILIDLPPLWRLGQSSKRHHSVAVGYTDEMRARWENALGHCTEKKRQRKTVRI